MVNSMLDCPAGRLPGFFPLVEVRRLALAGCVAVGVIVRYLVGRFKRVLTFGQLCSTIEGALTDIRHRCSFRRQ